MDYKEKVIALLNSQELSKEQKGILEDIFPELKESEDEKIRKEIISALKFANVKGVYDKHIAWLEKQAEQKPTGKVEPKFKVGDWITNGRYNRLVAGVNSRHYQFKDGDAKYIDDIDKKYHLWTIKDAKDGDVLVDSYSKDSIIILYKGIYKERSILAHCGWNGYNFSVKTNGLGYGGLDNTNYLPATKEQCDLLFEKMKETGHEWDGGKKELRKIEPKTLNADEVIEWLEKHIIEWKGQDLIRTFTPNSPAGKSYIVEQFKKDFGLC